MLISRPHSSGSCYQIGYIDKGTLKTTQSKPCVNGPPHGQKWFQVNVIATDKLVRVYKDNTFIVEFSSHFSAGGGVGVIGANGYDNEIRFQNLKLLGNNWK